MQKSDDVEVARMRKYVQARLLNWGHNLQRKEKDHTQHQQEDLRGTP